MTFQIIYDGFFCSSVCSLLSIRAILRRLQFNNAWWMIMKFFSLFVPLNREAIEKILPMLFDISVRKPILSNNCFLFNRFNLVTDGQRISSHRQLFWMHFLKWTSNHVHKCKLRDKFNEKSPVLLWFSIYFRNPCRKKCTVLKNIIIIGITAVLTYLIFCNPCGHLRTKTIWKQQIKIKLTLVSKLTISCSVFPVHQCYFLYNDDGSFGTFTINYLCCLDRKEEVKYLYMCCLAFYLHCYQIFIFNNEKYRMIVSRLIVGVGKRKRYWRFKHLRNVTEICTYVEAAHLTYKGRPHLSSYRNRIYV